MQASALWCEERMQQYLNFHSKHLSSIGINGLQEDAAVLTLRVKLGPMIRLDMRLGNFIKFLPSLAKRTSGLLKVHIQSGLDTRRLQQ
jgi:hypothetical protein